MEIEEYIELYKQNGGYVNTLRQHLGHAPIISVGVGVIVENDRGDILLQKRKDNGKWAIIGGSMELGETFEETIRREASEEAGITLGELKLLGICNGSDRFITYPNGDIVYGISVIYTTSSFTGDICSDPEETLEHQFFDRAALPADINPFDQAFIDMWLAQKK